MKEVCLNDKGEYKAFFAITYEEMPSQNAETQFAYNKHIYEKVDSFWDNDSLNSCYSSIKELRAQRKSVDLSHVYIPVNLAAKQEAKEQDGEHFYEEFSRYRRDNSSLDSDYSSTGEYKIQDGSINLSQQYAEASFAGKQETKERDSKHIYTEISNIRKRKNPLYTSTEECKA